MRDYEVEDELSLLIDFEAKRIMKILLDMHYKKTRVNKSILELTNELSGPEFKFFKIKLEKKVSSLIPLGLTICPTKEWVFITEEEYKEIFYKEQMAKISDKMNKNTQLIDGITERIIENYNNDNLKRKNILRIFSDYIPTKIIKDLDEELITYMIKNVVSNLNLNYEVSSINPLIINGL